MIGGPFGLGQRKAPAQLDEFVAVVGLSNDRRRIGRPDIIARFKVRRGAWQAHRNARLAERAQVIVIRDVVAEIVAHTKIQDMKGQAARSSLLTRRIKRRQ